MHENRLRENGPLASDSAISRNDSGRTAPDSAARDNHWAAVILVLAGLVTALLLVIHPDGAVAFRFAPDHALPQVCMSRQIFQVDCPGCGLTRSVVHLVHGRWAESFAIHRLGWLVGVVAGLQLIVSAMALQNRPLPIPMGRLVVVTAVLLMLNWVFNLL